MFNIVEETILVSDFDYFKKQLPLYDLLNSSVAVCDENAELFYNNKAFYNVNLQLRSSVESLIQVNSLLECDVIKDSIMLVLKQKKIVKIQQQFFSDKTTPVDLCFRFTPVCSQDSSKVQGVLCTIDNESIALNSKCFSRLQDVREKNKITPLRSSLLDDEPELTQLIDKYISRYPEMINDLKLAFDAEDLTVFEMRLHDIKSTGGNYGFMPVTDVSIMIKTHLDNRNYTAIPSLIAELEGLHKRMLQAVP